MIVRPFNCSEDSDLLKSAKFREADINEFKASGVDDIAEAVVEFSTIEDSTVSLILSDDGQLISVGGLVPYDGGIGSPWMVSTDLFDDHTLSLIKIVKPMLTEYLNSYNLLMGVIDIRNKKAMKFLSWLGFEFPEGAKLPIGETCFQQFIQKGQLAGERNRQ